MLKNRPILKRLKKHIPEKLPKQIASLLPTIHLMIVANTKDPLIGRGCKRDAKAMRELFGKLTEFIHIPLVETLIQGDSYSKADLVKALEAIKPKKKDFVIFYYTGHGFSYEKDKSQKYPQMDFRPNPVDNDIAVVNANTINFSEIFETFK